MCDHLGPVRDHTTQALGDNSPVNTWGHQPLQGSAQRETPKPHPTRK